jgi:hypothetical protein
MGPHLFKHNYGYLHKTGDGGTPLDHILPVILDAVVATIPTAPTAATQRLHGHGDFHAGNVMIELTSGSFQVVDFERMSMRNSPAAAVDIGRILSSVRYYAGLEDRMKGCIPDPTNSETL